MSRPVLIMAGGTGGHIFPGLAVADALRSRQIDVVWLGSRHGMENRLVPTARIRLERLSVRGLRGQSMVRRLLGPFQILRAVLQALRIVFRHRPRSVLSMGGFVAGPGGIAAWLLRSPLVIHEQNAIPGLTNKLLGRLATRLLCGFPGALGPESRHVGNPVREAICRLDAPEQRFAARTGPIRLLVLGGSQGARVLNQTLPEAVASIGSGRRPVVRHQVGRGRAAAVSAAYRQVGVEARVEEFIGDMAAAYDWADLVICRAGALTVAELAAAGLGAIYVPYRFAVDDHQTANARHMVEAGAGLLVPEPTLAPRSLGEKLAELADRTALLDMARAARGQARPDAAQVVADVLQEVAR